MNRPPPIEVDLLGAVQYLLATGMANELAEVIGAAARPAPPTLVRLPSDKPHCDVYVNPAHIVGIHAAYEDDRYSAIMAAGMSRRLVKGTPEEVAARLGLAVSDE